MNRSRATIVALAIVAMSVAWTAGVVSTSASPRATLTAFGTDHLSHWGSVLLFGAHGLDLYRRPVRQICGSTPIGQDRETVARTLDVQCQCWIEDFARPIAVNWQDYPRPYPPGNLLYFLPQAAAYRWAGWSFRSTNVFAIVQLVVAAHVAVVLLWLLLRGRVGGALPVVAALLAYAELVHWSLEGFFDAAGIGCLFWALLALARRRPAQSLLAYAIATSLHLRALWYAPVAVLALIEFWREGGWRPGRPDRWRGVVALTAAAIIAAATALVLWYLRPFLATFPDNNPLRQAGAIPASPAFVTAVVASLTLAACAAWRRSWLTLACLGSSWFFFLATTQVQWWHSLWLLPMPFLDLARTRSTSEAPFQRAGLIAVGLLWYAAMSRILYQSYVLEASWLAELLRRFL